MTPAPHHRYDAAPTAMLEPLEDRRLMSAVPVALRLLSGAATEGAGNGATFQVSRAKALSVPTRVFFSIGGTALPPVTSPATQVDYELTNLTILDPTKPQFTSNGGLKPFVDIPAGRTSTRVTVTPRDDSTAEGAETATFTIVPQAAYRVSNPSSATVSLFDNDFRINFQAAGSPAPAGYTADTGLAFGQRAPGVSFGWDVDNTASAVVRDNPASPDARYDSSNLMQFGFNHKWEIALPNGTYMVRVAVGDPNSNIANYGIGVEDRLALFARPHDDLRFFRMTGVVQVSDGRLTVTGALGSFNNRIDFIDIKSVPRRSLLGPIATVSTTLKTPATADFWHEQPNGLFSDNQIDEALWV